MIIEVSPRPGPDESPDQKSQRKGAPFNEHDGRIKTPEGFRVAEQDEVTEQGSDAIDEPGPDWTAAAEEFGNPMEFNPPPAADADTEWHHFARLIAVTLLLGAGVPLLAVWIYKPRPAETNPARNAQQERYREWVEEITPYKDKAIALAHQFFGATTPGEKIACIRGGESMMPLLWKYYSMHPDEPALKEGRSAEVRVFEDRDGRTLLSGTVENVDHQGVYFLIEKRGSALLLDWRGTLGVGDVPWEEFVLSRPQEAVTMRVIAETGDLYTGPFADQKKYRCLHLFDATNSNDCYAYVERFTPAEQSLRTLLRFPPHRVRAALRLRFTAESADFRVPMALVVEFDDRYQWLDTGAEMPAPAPRKAQASK